MNDMSASTMAPALRRDAEPHTGMAARLLARMFFRAAEVTENRLIAGGMHLIATPVGRFARTFDDVAVTKAAAEAGLVVQPLSVCYASRPKRHGLILGYAGTPEPEIERGVRMLRRVIGSP